MRKLGFAAAFVLLLALVAYAAGLGVYAVASTRPRVATQPRSAEEAQHALVQLELAPDYPFAHRFMLTPHGRMHYVDEGKGPVVLCLHGNGSWSLECAQFVLARSARSRALAPDLIGFGLSEKPARPPEDDVIEAHAVDLTALIAELDLREVQLVASKSSAAIAIRLAKLAPERVLSTVLEDASLPEPRMAARFADTPVVGELLAQGFGALSPGLARGPFGRVQGNWDERASSLALARAR
ncbi:MAG: alpha/beta fold hydrolase [Myxococcota bacterium]